MNSTTRRTIAKSALLALTVVAGVAAIIGSGGGGGGGDETTSSSTTLNYTLSGPRAPVPALSASAQGGTLSVSFPSNSPVQDLPWMTGTYDTTTLDVVLNSSADPVAWADMTGVPFGNVEIKVTQTFRWNNSNEPTVGEMTVTSRDGTFPGTIKIAVTSSPAPGVNISWDSDNNGTFETGPVFHTWDNFDVLWENAGTDLWQRVASATYSMRAILYENAHLAIETFATIEDIFDQLQSYGPGATLIGTCSPNPPVGAWTNQIQVRWNDLDGSGTISLNDSFTFTFDNCWVDDPGNDIDQVLNGEMDFLNYDRHVQACPAFVNLVANETNASGVIAGSDITFNGGLCLFIPGI
jgi:hypothetical protein